MLVYLSSYIDHIKLGIYLDMDWTGDIETKRSTISYITLLNRITISWIFKRQIFIRQLFYKVS